MTAPWGAGALHQRLNAFVKKSLIQQLVPPGAVVCDLYCGRGVDTENWGEAKIEKYVGVDLSSSALEEAKEEWEKNEKPFVARFCELNPCMAELEKHLGLERLSVDVVTCLSHMQDCFASEDMVRQLLKNVASLLKPGGFFFGATPDSSTIWYKYQKAVEGAMKAGSLRANGQLPRVKTELYSISFEDDRFNEYGSRYQLRFTDDSVPPQSQILVHFPSLIRRAEELGLECVEIQNLTEFYEDYRVPFAETLQKSCGTLVDAKGHPVVDGKSRLSPIAQDVLSLYTTFIFKKPDPLQREKALKRPAAPTPARTPAPADAKKSKKFSPALSHLLGPDDRPPKKQRSSASPAFATSNGSKVPETNPKQGGSSGSASRSIPDKTHVSKNEPARSSVKVAKPPVESKIGKTHINTSESKAQEKAPKPDMISSSEAPMGRASVEKTESPKPKGLGGHRTDSSPSGNKSNEGAGHRNDSSLMQANASDLKLDTSDQPSSSGLLPESHRRSGNESTGQAQPPSVKRKRVSRWSSDYIPRGVSSSHNAERKDDTRVTLQQGSDQGSADIKKAGGGTTPGARSQMEGDMVHSRLASSVHEAQIACGTLRDGAGTTASDGTPPHDGKLNDKKGPLSEQEPKEDGEVAAEDPASPTRERHAALKVVLSETVSGRSTESIGSETTQFNGSLVSESKGVRAIYKRSTASRGEADSASDPQPREGSTTTTILEQPTQEKPTMDQQQGKRNKPDEQLTNHLHHHQQKGTPPPSSAPALKNAFGTTNSETKKEQSVNPRPRKKEIAMDVLLDRASTATDNATTTERPSEPPKKRDPELALGSDQKKELASGEMMVSSRDIISPSSDLTRRDSFGSRREAEPAWETKPQRYTLRRAASTAQVVSESPGMEHHQSPPVWSRDRSSAAAKMVDRGSVTFHPRVSYVASPVGGGGGPAFGARLRAPSIRAEDRSRVVSPLVGGFGAGLLGAAPSPAAMFAERGTDRRFVDMIAGGGGGPSEGGHHTFNNDLRTVAPRPTRPHISPSVSTLNGVGSGASWDDAHFPNDARSRSINR